MDTGIIHESKNGRWVITRGQNKWRVNDRQSKVKCTVTRQEDGFVCDKPIPAYLMRHIEHDAEILDAFQARQAVIEGVQS